MTSTHIKTIRVNKMSTRKKASSKRSKLMCPKVISRSESPVLIRAKISLNMLVNKNQAEVSRAEAIFRVLEYQGLRLTNLINKIKTSKKVLNR